MNHGPPPAADAAPQKTRLRLALAAFLAIGVCYWCVGDRLSLKNIAAYEQLLRETEKAHPTTFILGAFLLYVSVSGLSIPGGAVALSLAYGSYFGWTRGVILVSFASTLGATIAFLSSRYLFRDMFQTKLATQLDRVNRQLETEGAFYLFTLRLIPLVPFFLCNLIMGLTKMRTSTYWWISQLGMLPGTMAYLYAGSTLKIARLARDGWSGLGWEFAVGFSLLGILPLAIRQVLKRVRANQR